MSRIKTSACLAVLATIAGSSVHAEWRPEKFDTAPKDGYLSGAELQAYRDALQALSKTDNWSAAANMQGQLDDWAARYGETADVPLANLEVYQPVDCTAVRPYLRDNVQEATLFGCGQPRGLAKGASLSASRDYEADSLSVALKGGLALPFKTGPKDGSDFDYLSAWGLSVFAQVDGTFRDPAEDTGYARAGLKLDLTSGAFGVDEVLLVSSLYEQTDFAGKARGTGFQMTLVPQLARYNLNAEKAGVPAKGQGPVFLWTLRGTIDAYRSKESGVTNLDDDTDYLWTGGTIGAKLLDRHIFTNGLLLGVSADLFHDQESGRDAILYSATAQVTLNPDETTTLGLNYESGRKRQTMERTESLNLEIAFKF